MSLFSPIKHKNLSTSPEITTRSPPLFNPALFLTGRLPKPSRAQQPLQLTRSRPPTQNRGAPSSASHLGAGPQVYRSPNQQSASSAAYQPAPYRAPAKPVRPDYISRASHRLRAPEAKHGDGSGMGGKVWNGPGGAQRRPAPAQLAQPAAGGRAGGEEYVYVNARGEVRRVRL